MYLNEKKRYFSVLPILVALLVPSLQTDGIRSNMEAMCHAPETHANTICKLESNATYPVASKTKLRCFCTYNGEDSSSSMTIATEENKEELELECLDNGTWSRESPIHCAHNSTEEHPHIQIFKLEIIRAGEPSLSFAPENMTLFPVFASGTQCVTLYIIGLKDNDIQKELAVILGQPKYMDTEVDLTYEGFPLSTHYWHSNSTAIIKNVEILNEKFNVKVIHKPHGRGDWAIFTNEKHHKFNSNQKAITLNVTYGQAAVITGVTLELFWDFVVSNISIDGEKVNTKIEWNETRLIPFLILEYPHPHNNTSTIKLDITSSKERYEWPLHDICVVGEKGDCMELSSQLVCGGLNYCRTVEDFQKQGRYFPTKYNSISIKLNISSEAFIHKINLGFYDPVDIKLKSGTGDIHGVLSVVKENYFIKFHYPEPIVMQSDIQLTLESSNETWHWPIKDIKLEGQRGHPRAWCPPLINITKVITTVDMCIHFAGEKLVDTAQVRKSYTDAAEQCATINGRLVEPKNKHLQDLLKNNCKTFMYYWIGLTRTNHSGKWKWNSGDTLESENNFISDCSKNDAGELVKEAVRTECETSKNETCAALQREYGYAWVPRKCERTCKYICQSGYIGCGIPGKKKITLMKITETSNGFPREVQYECPEGFELKGNATRRCTEEGVWTDMAPTCEEEPPETTTQTDETSIATTLYGSEQESTSIITNDPTTTDRETTVTNNTDQASADSETRLIHITATSVIVICTTISLILIGVSIALCWKRRSRKQSPEGNEILDIKQNEENKPSTYIKPSHLEDQQHATRKPDPSNNPRSQQEIEMVESDIYGSFGLENENDMYGTM